VSSERGPSGVACGSRVRTRKHAAGESAHRWARFARVFSRARRPTLPPVLPLRAEATTGASVRGLSHKPLEPQASSGPKNLAPGRRVPSTFARSENSLRSYINRNSLVRAPFSNFQRALGPRPEGRRLFAASITLTDRRARIKLSSSTVLGRGDGFGIPTLAAAARQFCARPPKKKAPFLPGWDRGERGRRRLQTARTGTSNRTESREARPRSS